MRSFPAAILEKSRLLLNSIDEPKAKLLVISKATLAILNEKCCPMDSSTKNSAASALTPIERVLVISSLIGLVFGLCWAFYGDFSLWDLVFKGFAGLLCGQALGCLLLELKKH